MSETPELDYLNALQCQNNNLVRENLALEAENAELKSIVERLESLAVKWVDAGHHDWPEIKELIKRMDELTATQPEESAEEK